MHKIQNLPVIFPLKDIDNYLNYLIDRVSTRFQLLILALQHKQSSYVGVPFDSLHKSNLGWCRLGSVSNALNNRSVISRVSLEIWAHRDHLKMSCWWRWRHISAGDRVWKTESKTLLKKWKDGSIKECACLTNSFIHTVFYFHVQNLHPFRFQVLSREYAVVSNAVSCAVSVSASPATASHHLFIQAHIVTIAAVFTITKHPTKWAETSPSFYQLSILWSPFDVILVKLLSGFGHAFT